MTTKWIKCSERIPEIQEHVYMSKPLLLYLPKGSDGISAPLIEKGFFANTLGNELFVLPFSRVKLKLVTHYMELPNPPEGEE